MEVYLLKLGNSKLQSRDSWDIFFREIDISFFRNTPVGFILQLKKKKTHDGKHF